MTWPRRPEHIALLYNSEYAVLTVATGFFVHPALAYVTALAWTSGWLWEAWVRPWMYPEREMSQEEKTREQFRRGLKAQEGRQLAKLEQRVRKLEEGDG